MNPGHGAAPRVRRSAGDRRARVWLLVALAALTGVLVLAAFPAQARAAQRRETVRVTAEVGQLEAQNRTLEAKTALLQTDGEIERMAREHYNLVRPGEELFAVIFPPVPAPLPDAARPQQPEPKAQPERAWWQRALTRLTDVF